MMRSKAFLLKMLLYIGATIFYIGIIFLIVEWYMGTMYTKEHKRIAAKMEKIENGLCYAPSPNPTLIYTLIPSNSNNDCEVNSYGYRDYEYPPQKEANTFRIIIIGDSVAQGYGVTLEETFGKSLERQLNNPPPNTLGKVEVISLARNGYSTNQELVVLESQALSFSPDLIIWSYSLNDPADPLFHNANGEVGKFFYQPTLHSLFWLKKQIFFRKEKIKGKHCEKEYHEFLHCVYWQQVKAHLNQLGNVSKEENIPILFLIHPLIEKGKNYQEYSLTSLHLKLGNLARNTGLIVLDILDIYQPFHSDDIKQFVEGGFDPWHPNAQGHRIIAEYIASQMRKGQYIQQGQKDQELAILKNEESFH